MGSGLIWAGIGKGIADAGSTYGNLMFKAAESELADQRAMQKAEYLERLKAQMSEESAQRDATKAIEIEARAEKIGQDRATKQLDTDVKGLIGKQSQIAGSSPAASEEEIRKLIEQNPQYREIYREAGYIDKAPSRSQQRLQGAEDTVQAARELGASSTLIKSYQDSKRAVLDEIRLENQERKDDRRYELDTAREDRRDRESRDRANYQDRMAGAAETRAAAAETRANRPPAEGRGSSQERLTTMINSANQTIRSLNESSRGKTPDEKAEWERQMSDAKRLRDNAQKQLNKLFDEDGPAPAKTEAPKAKASDNGNVKSAPVISSLPKGAVQVGTSGGKPVYQTPDGKKFIAK